MSSGGFSMNQCNGFLPVPFTKSLPILLAAFGASYCFQLLNNRNFPTIETMSPEYKTRENIIMRTGAPAVFINPISSGLPGNILGPDDLEATRG